MLHGHGDRLVMGQTHSPIPKGFLTNEPSFRSNACKPLLDAFPVGRSWADRQIRSRHGYVPGMARPSADRVAPRSEA